MSGQGDFFGRPAKYPDVPGHRSVATSVAAAASIIAHVPRMQQKIIDYLALRPGGCIYTEIVDGCGLATPTVCGRMREMVLRRDEQGRAAPLVRDSGITRPTPSNRQATVYVLTPLGRSKATVNASSRSA